MTDERHSKDRLADELAAAGLDNMAEKARQGYYHDFLSPLDMPAQQLAVDLTAAIEGGNEAARLLLDRHLTGDFDATAKESDEWWQGPEGKDAFAQLIASMPSGSAKSGPQKKQIGRLAMRVEDDWWIARYAVPDSMEGAIELGRIRMALVERQDRKNAFMQLMTDVLSDLFQGTLGQRPKMRTQPAPEHERQKPPNVISGSMED